MLTALAMAGFILAAGTVGGSGTIKILIYKDPGFQQDWASSGPEGDYKTILVTNPNSQDLTDFQVKLVFDPSSDSFFDSCQGGSLLGIWTGNGSRQVPFWVENWSATQAILWFKAPVYFNDFSSSLDFDQYPYGLTFLEGYDASPWMLESGMLKHVQQHASHESAIKNILIRDGAVRVKWNIGVLQYHEQMGIRFRFIDQVNHYFFRYNGYDRAFQLRKFVSSQKTPLGAVPFRAANNTWYEMECRFYRDSLKCYYRVERGDWVEVITATDSDLAEGYFGLHGAWNKGVVDYFDDLLVRKYVEPEPTASLQ